MWAALVVVVLVVTVVAAVSVLRRPRGSDLNSVRQYHSALGTIEQMSARSGKSSVRVVGPAGGPGTDAGLAGAGDAGHPDSGSGSVPPATPGGSDEPAGRGGPLVFDDARPKEGYQVTSARPAAVSRTDRVQRHALHSMNRRPRRGTWVMVAVVALALFGALAFIGSRRSPSTGPHGATASTVADPASAAHSTTTSSTASGTSRPKSHARGKGGTPRPPPTTIPSAIVASSSTAVSAVYPVADNSYRVAVSVAAPCWVLATTVSNGATLWTGTLQTGATQVIQATGVVKVELGALSATLTVDNVPVTLPTPAHTPFVATFQPSATSPPGSTTTLAPTVTSTTIPAG